MTEESGEYPSGAHEARLRRLEQWRQDHDVFVARVTTENEARFLALEECRDEQREENANLWKATRSNQLSLAKIAAIVTAACTIAGLVAKFL